MDRLYLEYRKQSKTGDKNMTYAAGLESGNKAAAAIILGVAYEDISSVQEQHNSYFVKLHKGRNTFISKPKMFSTRRVEFLKYWMEDAKKAGCHRIQIGTASKGLVTDFGELNFTSLEIALYEYRKGLKMQNQDDSVILGEYHTGCQKWVVVDSYYPQFEVK